MFVREHTLLTRRYILSSAIRRSRKGIVRRSSSIFTSASSGRRRVWSRPSVGRSFTSHSMRQFAMRSRTPQLVRSASFIRCQKYPFVSRGLNVHVRYYRQKGEVGCPNRFEALLTPEEQHDYWDRCVAMVLTDTRWVLDNLDRLPEFKVGWEDYHSKTYKQNRKVYNCSTPK